MPSFMQRFRSGWNAFLGRDPTSNLSASQLGYGYSYRPDRMRYTRGNYRSVVASVYNRIAVDVSAIHFEHARLDKDGNFAETIDSDYNNKRDVSHKTSYYRFFTRYLKKDGSFKCYFFNFLSSSIVFVQKIIKLKRNEQ